MRKYNCPYCTERFYKQDLAKHIEKKHDDLLPENYTAYRMAYDVVNNKQGHGNCTECGKPTEWNEKRQKYARLCGDPKCYQKVKETYRKRMMRVYNKIHLLDDPIHQEKMLANRKISGKYKWSDGKVMTYTGQYEKKLMEFLDKTLEFESNEVLAPGPILEYEYKGKMHHWITDFLILPLNLIIEVKDGGDNPNTKSMPVTRAKTIAKEKMITNMGKYNYLRLTNNDFLQLFQLMAELKEKAIDDEDDNTPLYRIHESDEDILNESIFNNNFLATNEIKKFKPTKSLDRRKIIGLIKPIIKELLSKYSKFNGKAFVNLNNENDHFYEESLKEFLSMKSEELYIGNWNLWDAIPNPRSDTESSKKIFGLLDIICIQFYKMIPDKRFFLSYAGGDWDDGPLDLIDITQTSDDYYIQDWQNIRNKTQLLTEDIDMDYLNKIQYIKLPSLSTDQPYIIIEGKNYRPRVELLLIKDGKVLCMKQDKINQYGTNYKLPGGAIDKGRSLIDQVQAECQEELLIIPKNIKFVTGYVDSYNGIYPEWQKKKLWNYDFRYEGCVTFVFTGEEYKKYNKYVKVIDREERFAKEAKYHDIRKLKYRPEHLEALEDYINNNTKEVPVLNESDMEKIDLFDLDM